MLIAFWHERGDNVEVIEVTEPQVWTIIGVLIAGMFGLITIVTTSFNRVLRAEMGGVRGEIGSLRREVTGEIDSLRQVMDARFDAVDARFTSLEAKVDSIDRDVQGIIKREIDRS